MINALGRLLKCAVPATAAAILVIGTAGSAIAHEDVDDDWHGGEHHDWHSGPHFGPHERCHWDPVYGYHCGPHFGPHAGTHHDWHYGPHYGPYESPYYGSPGWWR